MSTIATAVNVSGTADAEDRQAISLAILDENERRVSLGLAALPSATAGESRSSYQTILLASVVKQHANNIAVAIAATNSDAALRTLKVLWLDATPAKKAAAVAALA